MTTLKKIRTNFTRFQIISSVLMGNDDCANFVRVTVDRHAPQGHVSVFCFGGVGEEKIVTAPSD